MDLIIFTNCISFIENKFHWIDFWREINREPCFRWSKFKSVIFNPEYIILDHLTNLSSKRWLFFFSFLNECFLHNDTFNTNTFYHFRLYHRILYIIWSLPDILYMFTLSVIIMSCITIIKRTVNVSPALIFLKVFFKRYDHAVLWYFMCC